MKEQKLNQVELKGTCIGCDKTITLTSKQILEGERDGAAMSDCCFMPIIVERATFTSSRKRKANGSM